jgi:hypothetical protein
MNISRQVRYAILFLLIVCSQPLHAQDQPPFTFTLQGGLFIPSKEGFKETFQASSDLIWGAGVSLPLGSGLFVTGEISYFRTEGLPDPAIDSTAEYHQRIIHVGIIHKRLLADRIMLRLSGGFNRISVQQKMASSRSTERSLETGNRFGYFGGIGVEQLLDDPHLSFFADVIYDYSRSRERDFPGDFGGVRIVLGVNFILF